MTEELKLPGDKIAMIEEYLPGDNTFEDGHSIRSTSVGTIELNKSEQLVSIQKKKSISIPNIGDIIIGTVEASLGSMIAVSIEYVNNIRSTSNVECICSIRHLRKKNTALVKDIVKLKILSHVNGTIHAGIDEHDLGVLFTKCRKCFGAVVKVRDAVKCSECGWIDDRKLSSDFEKADFLKFDEHK
jgi:exosome complex component CSL4|tara:strand:+ start:6831 stop:7388 length:558 start_codon:yes stop_codon:yes gene_type:complete